MLTTYLHYGLLIALAIALVLAALTDIRRRQIDNWLTGAIALAAPAFWWTSGLSPWPDLAWQIGFALMVSFILIALWGLGDKIGMVILGGGDVKLLAALSLWLAPLLYLDLLIIMAMAGGLLAVGFVIRRVVFKPKKTGVLPYGVAIAFGGIWVIATNFMPEAALAFSTP